MEGWIKLHRQIVDSPVFAHPTALKIWIWFLCRANYKEKTVQLSVGNGITSVTIKPGQFIFGRHKAEEELGIDGSTVYKWLKKFETDMNMIKVESNTKYSVVTILKFSEFQVEEEPSGSSNVAATEQQSSSNVAAEEQQRNTDKNVNNDKKDKKNNTPALILRDGTKVDDIEFNYIFSEQLIESKTKTYTGINVADQLQKFKEKIFSAPDAYTNHDSNGLRLAFDYQLRTVKPEKQKPNGYQPGKFVA
jgi:hypothetical protein